MPRNMVTARAPIAASVVAALRLLGLRKAGTPLLMASTPVSAVHPEAKARIASSTRAIPVYVPSAVIGSVADSARMVSPVPIRNAATANMR